MTRPFQTLTCTKRLSDPTGSDLVVFPVWSIASNPQPLFQSCPKSDMLFQKSTAVVGTRVLEKMFLTQVCLLTPLKRCRPDGTLRLSCSKVVPCVELGPLCSGFPSLGWRIRLAKPPF